jgi:hypothetical protein
VSFTFACRITKREKPHSIGKSSLLLDAIDIFGTVLCDSYAKDLWKILLPGDTMGRKNI